MRRRQHFFSGPYLNSSIAQDNSRMIKIRQEQNKTTAVRLIKAYLDPKGSREPAMELLDAMPRLWQEGCREMIAFFTRVMCDFEIMADFSNDTVPVIIDGRQMRPFKFRSHIFFSQARFSMLGDHVEPDLNVDVVIDPELIDKYIGVLTSLNELPIKNPNIQEGLLSYNVAYQHDMPAATALLKSSIARHDRYKFQSLMAIHKLFIDGNFSPEVFGFTVLDLNNQIVLQIIFSVWCLEERHRSVEHANLENMIQRLDDAWRSQAADLVRELADNKDHRMLCSLGYQFLRGKNFLYPDLAIVDLEKAESYLIVAHNRAGANNLTLITSARFLHELYSSTRKADAKKAEYWMQQLLALEEPLTLMSEALRLLSEKSFITASDYFVRAVQVAFDGGEWWVEYESDTAPHKLIEQVLTGYHTIFDEIQDSAVLLELIKTLAGLAEHTPIFLLVSTENLTQLKDLLSSALPDDEKIIAAWQEVLDNKTMPDFIKMRLDVATQLAEQGLAKEAPPSPILLYPKFYTSDDFTQLLNKTEKALTAALHQTESLVEGVEQLDLVDGAAKAMLPRP